MFDKLNQIEEKYKELSAKLSSQSIDYSSKEYRDILKEHGSIERTYKVYEKYKIIENQIKENLHLIENTDDQELILLAKEEINEKNIEKNVLYNELFDLINLDNAKKYNSIIVEIRAGTGGDEAALFSGDLFRMYSRYAENKKWKVEILSYSESEVGGYKEVIFSIDHPDAFYRLKYEMGVHRVQRIPLTETGGRIHTSTVTVAILPEEEEMEIEILPNDLRIDVFRSSGPGGQSVNTTDSAVRVTHVPTGIVVQCQDEKSQHKNKVKAMRVLQARLQEKFRSEQQEEIARERKSQIGTGDRSERIRTYNFPQNRITDHRIGYSIYNKMNDFLDGNIEDMIQKILEENKKKINV